MMTQSFVCRGKNVYNKFIKCNGKHKKLINQQVYLDKDFINSWSYKLLRVFFIFILNVILCGVFIIFSEIFIAIQGFL